MYMESGLFGLAAIAKPKQYQAGRCSFANAYMDNVYFLKHASSKGSSMFAGL